MIKTYQDLVHELTRYAPGKLFTKDSPSKKEKKLEARCVIIVDTFFNMNYFAELRGKLSAVVLYQSLGHNEYGTESFIVECAELQAYVEWLSKLITNSVKPEKCLVEFYDHNLPVADFSVVLETLLAQLALSNSKVPCDVKRLKVLYFNTLKLTRKNLKEDSRYSNML